VEDGVIDKPDEPQETPPTLPVVKLKDWLRSSTELHKKGGKVGVRLPGGDAVTVMSMQDIDPEEIPE
jgi:hypothetical protein